MDKIIRFQLTMSLDVLMLHVVPNNYENFIAYKKGIPVIYLRLKNLLYGRS